MLELVLWGYRSAVAWILDLNPGDHWPIIVGMGSCLTTASDSWRHPLAQLLSDELQTTEWVFILVIQGSKIIPAA